MTQLEGEKRTVGEILSRGYFFRVPQYQRPFSWDTDNFDDLIDDITSADRAQEYFLGTLVLHHQENDKIFDIVDGQQRITSLLILTACLRDLIDDEKFRASLQNRILQERDPVDDIPEKPRIEVKDRDVFHSIVVSPKGTDTLPAVKRSEEPEWRYVTAIKVFREKLEQLNQSELKAIAQFISQRCVVIFLSTPGFEDAFRLFTIVNDRGKQLRRIDVLKATNMAPDVIASESVRERIAKSWEDREKTLGESVFESVFHLIRLIYLKDKPQGDLLKEFQNRILGKRLLMPGEPFFQTVFQYTDLYSKIFIDREILDDGDRQHLKFHALIHIMDSEFRASEWRACVLEFCKKFRGDKLYEFCLKMEKIYLSLWVNSVRKDERYEHYARLLELIGQARSPAEVLRNINPSSGGTVEATRTKSKDQSIEIPYNAEAITEAVGRTDFYNASFARYFLLRLELLASEHDVLKEITARSVEHVLPQTPNPDGDYWATHFDLAEISEYVDSIGNLVLLSKSKNSAASNFEFERKKDVYLKPRISDYPRSLQVLGYKDWTKDVIENRTAEAKEQILKDL